MILGQNNISEIWQAGKNLIIPAGTTAYHLNPPHREYTPGSKLKADDRRGNILVSRKEFSVHLREVPVMLRRGDSGPCVHLVWCSLNFAVANLAQISTKIDSTKSFLSFDELEERLKPHVSEALQSFEEYDLTSKNGRKLFESQAANRISVIPSFEIKKCTLRRVLLEQDYFEEKKSWAEFEQRLRQLSTDERIWQGAEKNRLEQTLAKFESNTILALLTKEEKKLAAVKRLSRYIDLLLPTERILADKAPEPCPYLDCRVDLSVGQTFVCQHCENKMHAWHKSTDKPDTCDWCYEHIRTTRRRVFRYVAIVLFIVVAIFIAQFYIQLGLEEKAAKFFDAKEYAQAFHAYCRLSDRDITNIVTHRWIEKCARIGHLERQFLERYLRMVERNPQSAVLRNYLGNAYLMLDLKDREGKAQKQYEKALSCDPKFAPPLNNLAIIASRQGDNIKAESMFQRYLDACPEDAPAWVNFGLLYLAKVEKDPNDIETVGITEKAFNRAIQLQQGLASGYKGLGRLFAATEQKEKALAAFRQSLALNRDQPQVNRQIELLEWDLDMPRSGGALTDDMTTRGKESGNEKSNDGDANKVSGK